MWQKARKLTLLTKQYPCRRCSSCMLYLRNVVHEIDKCQSNPAQPQITYYNDSHVLWLRLALADIIATFYGIDVIPTDREVSLSLSGCWVLHHGDNKQLLPRDIIHIAWIVLNNLSGWQTSLKTKVSHVFKYIAYKIWF